MKITRSSTHAQRVVALSSTAGYDVASSYTLALVQFGAMLSALASGAEHNSASTNAALNNGLRGDSRRPDCSLLAHIIAKSQNVTISQLGSCARPLSKF